MFRKNGNLYSLVKSVKLDVLYKAVTMLLRNMEALGSFSYIPFSLKIVGHGSIKIGANVRIGRNVRFETQRNSCIKIGNDCNIEDGVIITAGESGYVVIGDFCSINAYSVISGHGGIKIGNQCRIASHVSIVSFDHGIEMHAGPIFMQKKVLGEITIGEDVWIGAGVVVLRNSHISSHSVVAAGSVVNKSFMDDGSIICGIPARCVKERH